MSGVCMIGEKVPCFVNGGEGKELGYGQTIYHEFSGSNLPCTVSIEFRNQRHPLDKSKNRREEKKKNEMRKTQGKPR